MRGGGACFFLWLVRWVHPFLSPVEGRRNKLINLCCLKIMGQGLNHRGQFGPQAFGHFHKPKMQHFALVKSGITSPQFDLVPAKPRFLVSSDTSCTTLIQLQPSRVLTSSVSSIVGDLPPVCL